jgi:hypothetical protein
LPYRVFSAALASRLAPRLCETLAVAYDAQLQSCYPVKSLPSLASLDSAFQLQEYISLLIRLDPHDVDHIVTLPGKLASKDKDATNTEEKEAEKEGEKEVTVDEACWIYEQLR